MLQSIDKLVGLLEGLVRGVRMTSRRFLGLVLPFWARASDYKAWGPGLRWSLRILFLVVIFFLVWRLQRRRVDVVQEQVARRRDGREWLLYQAVKLEVR